MDDDDDDDDDDELSMMCCRMYVCIVECKNIVCACKWMCILIYTMLESVR